MAFSPSISGEQDEVRVLIAGGGMVGLSAATFLAQQAYRAIDTYTATREPVFGTFFKFGVLDYLAGRKLADIIPNLNEGVDALSPCRRLFLNQRASNGSCASARVKPALR